MTVRCVQKMTGKQLAAAIKVEGDSVTKKVMRSLQKLCGDLSRLIAK